MHVVAFYVQSQLRSLAAGLEAHGGGVADSHRGAGWEGWLEESGALSPEGTQARGTSCMDLRGHGPNEASLCLFIRHRAAYIGVLCSRSHQMLKKNPTKGTCSDSIDLCRVARMKRLFIAPFPLPFTLLVHSRKQMRDMLENVGVRRLGPVEASFLLDKRLKGDQRAALRHHSAAAAAVPEAIADAEGSGSPSSSGRMERGAMAADGARGDRASSNGRIETAGDLSTALRETALRSYG